MKKYYKWRIQWELTTSLSKAETELPLQYVINKVPYVDP